VFEKRTSTVPDDGQWRLVTTESGFHDLRQDWEDLFVQNPMHSPFLAWGWVAAWLRHLAGPHELSILVWQNERGVAQFIVPLIVRERSRMFGRRTVMLACGYGREASDYLGCLRLPQHDSRIGELTAYGIAKLVDSTLSISLTELDGRVEYESELRAKMRGLGRLTRSETQNVCVAVDLAGTWDEYLQGLSSNFRSQVRRRCRTTENEESLAFRSVTAAESRKFTEKLIRLNRQRMAHKGKRSSLEDDNIREFLLESVPYMAANNIAWMDVLEKDGKTVAAALNFVHGKSAFFYIGGIDHLAQKWGPGTALFAHIIMRCIRQKYLVYDFLRGKEDYKYKWGGTDVPMHKLDIYGVGMFRGRVVWAFDKVSRRLTRAARRLVRRV
jgi:CelD/BcsL family acetyltransferase involved in cellulose biosynthesis